MKDIYKHLLLLLLGMALLALAFVIAGKFISLNVLIVVIVVILLVAGLVYMVKRKY